MLHVAEWRRATKSMRLKGYSAAVCGGRRTPPLGAPAPAPSGAAVSKPDLTMFALGRFFESLGVGLEDQITWSWGPYYPLVAGSNSKPEWCHWGTLQGTRQEYMADLPRLRRMNKSVRNGGHACSIFVRVPAGLVYFDDMHVAGLSALRAHGVVPRAIVETSAGSYQVFVRVPDGASPLHLYLGVQLECGADPDAHPAGDGLQTRLARLPGFINTKPNRAGDWVRGEYTKRPEPLSSMQALRYLALKGEQQSITAAPEGAGAQGAQKRRLTPAAEGDYSLGSDCSPSGDDMRLAVRMAARGADFNEIATAVCERRVSRGKAQKDSLRNARRTAERAVAYVQSRRSR